jgi:hypothetical protein
MKKIFNYFKTLKKDKMIKIKSKIFLSVCNYERKNQKIKIDMPYQFIPIFKEPVSCQHLLKLPQFN